MKWEDFKWSDHTTGIVFPYMKTDIECPKCGKPVYKNQSFCYTTNPPKYEYVCFECGWKGIA